jgi:hypothetical protein
MAKVVCEFLRECGLELVGPVGELERAVHMARVHALDLLSSPVPRSQAILIPVEYRSAAIIFTPFEPDEIKDILAQMLGLTGSTLPTTAPGQG